MTHRRGFETGLDVARIRQGSYRLLAAGYGWPSPEVTTGVAAGFEALLELGVADFAFAPALHDWVRSLEAADPTQVAAEHVRLFGAGMDGAVCTPIESQHLGSNLHGDPARHAGRIEDLMRRSGFASRDSTLPPDHLQTQLELASALCGGEAQARAAGERADSWLEWQAEIVVVLRSWVGSFAADVAERDRVGVLGDLTAATAAVVEHDHDVVRILMTVEGATT
jgi:TorA maturation chaperone TorD